MEEYCEVVFFLVMIASSFPSIDWDIIGIAGFPRFLDVLTVLRVSLF